MPSPIRILQLANQAGPLNLFILPICDALRGAGYEVELACMAGGPLWKGLETSGYPLHALRPGGWANPLTWLRTHRQVRGLLRRVRYDLLIVHTPVMSWIARLAARGLVSKTIYFAHGLPFAPVQPWPVYHLLRWVECRLARFTDAVVVINQADRQACARYRLTRPGGRCFHVPGVGLDVDFWSTPPDPQEIAQLERQLALRPGKPLVLFLGRFIAAKRPGDVLAAARRIGDRADFLLAGDGPLWGRIDRQARQIGPHVRVIRFTHEVRALMHRAAVLAMPSVFREGLPRVLLEAQAAGAPPVAYDVRGSRDAIEPDRTGLLVPPGDAEAFCRAIQRLLDDELLRRRMALEGQQWVRGNFALSLIVPQHVRVIQEVLAPPDSPASTAPSTEQP